MASSLKRNGFWAKPERRAAGFRKVWLAAAALSLLLAGGCDEKESPYASSPGKSRALRAGNTVLGYGRVSFWATDLDLLRT